uniref:Tim10-like domain-containing protein n=2 Tax=Felis catus TaxID=9685 RepID=A0ABI7ZFQ7_FELCA
MQGGCTLRTLYGEKKQNSYEQLQQDRNFQELSFRLSIPTSALSGSDNALGKTSGRVGNRDYRHGFDRSQMGKRNGGIPCSRGLVAWRQILTALPSLAGDCTKNLRLPGPLTSASLRTTQDTQPPEIRHLSPEGSRSPSNPEAVTRLLPPLDNERKQETGKCLVNRKSGAGARPPRMRTHACKKAGSSRWTMAELGEADEAELQRLVAAEQQKAQFTAQVHHFMELCWDKCVEKPGNRLDSRTENCLSSCVDRFIDTTLAITSRFAQIVQKGGQ